MPAHRAVFPLAYIGAGVGRHGHPLDSGDVGTSGVGRHKCESLGGTIVFHVLVMTVGAGLRCPFLNGGRSL